MKGLLPEWIETFEAFQETPLQVSAEIDELLEISDVTLAIEETREFLTDRYNALQDMIDEMKAAMASGSQVLLMNEDERAGWDARVKAEELERSARNVGS